MYAHTYPRALLTAPMLPRRDLFSSMLPKWHALLQTDLRMLVFSGKALLLGWSCTSHAAS